MPLLAPTENVQPTQADKIARQVSRLTEIPNQVKGQLISAYKQGHSLLWGNQGEVTPAQRIAKLNETGAAAELLAIEGAVFAFLTQVLAQQDAGALAEVTALHEAIPAHSISQDGTVTLD
jgi:hypothetical protein